MQVEFILERERLKSQSNKWKLASIALLVGVLCLIFSSWFKQNISSALSNEKYIASVEISGVILENATRDKRLMEIKDKDEIAALVVMVDSPGGTLVGSEKIYNILKDIASKKPVVVLMGTMAASGGYFISLAGDHIISHNGTVTGSIGVIFQTPEVTELAEKIGVKFNNFKSGALKASPNPMEKLTPEAEVAVMSSIMDSYDYFVSIVSERRKIPKEEAIKIADGRIYTGRQALKLKLIDAIGNASDAKKWLHENKKIDKDLKLRDFSLKNDGDFLRDIISQMSSFVGGSFGSLKPSAGIMALF